MANEVSLCRAACERRIREHLRKTCRQSTIDRHPTMQFLRGDLNFSTLCKSIKTSSEHFCPLMRVKIPASLATTASDIRHYFLLTVVVSLDS